MLSEAAEAAELPAPPASVATVDVQPAEGPGYTVTLTELRTWRGKRLAAEPGAHLTQPATALSPALVSGTGEVVWLVGYALTQREAPGDTLRTYSLLLELAPNPEPGVVRAVWFEDRGEVPRDLYAGFGRVEKGAIPGVLRVELPLQHLEYGDTLTVTGLVRRP